MIRKEIVICTEDKLVGSVFTIEAATPAEFFDLAEELAIECNKRTDNKHELKFRYDLLFPIPPQELVDQVKSLTASKEKLPLDNNKHLNSGVG